MFHSYARTVPLLRAGFACLDVGVVATQSQRLFVFLAGTVDSQES